jgi:hypothetical protein
MDLSDLLALALATLAGQAGASVAPRASAETAAAAAPAAEVVEAEHFALEIEPVDPLGEEGPLAVAPVGLAVWRRRIVGDSEQVEWQVRFTEAELDDTQVLHVERLGSERTKLVWREWRPHGGRTLVGDWIEDSRHLRLLEWGQRETLRLTIPFEADTVLPLALQERARKGQAIEGPLRLFDPLSRSLERVAVEVTELDGETARRLVEVRRADGSLVSAWEFAGPELVSFRWQAGTLRGRRISAEEYRARLRTLDPEPN